MPALVDTTVRLVSQEPLAGRLPTSVILDLANVGVDVFRLDAIAFLWKRLGTTCQGEPEVHQVVQALRAATRVAAPAVIFKAEAIVAPEDLPAYLGTGWRLLRRAHSSECTTRTRTTMSRSRRNCCSAPWA